MLYRMDDNQAGCFGGSCPWSWCWNKQQFAAPPAQVNISLVGDSHLDGKVFAALLSDLCSKAVRHKGGVASTRSQPQAEGT